MDKPDGIFWMELDDFIEQFKNIYICRLLKEEEGWNKIAVDGKWDASNAEGLKTARLDKNAQYLITVSKPCDGFIHL